MKIITRRNVIVLLVLLVLASFALYESVYRWGYGRVFVGPDDMLVVISRVGDDLPAGQILAGPNQKGVRAETLGSGRHFLDPINESWEIHPLIHVHAGTPAHMEGDQAVNAVAPEVGIVTALVGTPLPEGEFLAEKGQKGIWRNVLTAGKYRLNPYAYKVDVVPATVIEPGFVGVQTHLAGANTNGELAGPNERGVMAQVLMPGTYYLNPHEYTVTPVRIGYSKLTYDTEQAIAMLTSDGQTVKIDATILWGIYPGDAPHIVKQFGTQKRVVDLVIRPQAESIMRLKGSTYTARQFVEGDSRELFQQAVTAALKSELEQKNIRVLLTLVRNIEVPDQIKRPIQASKIAQELNLTNKVKIETTKVQIQLNEIKGTVEIESASARTETAKLVQEERARGQAEVARLDAETELKVSEMLADAARVKGEAQKVLGKADADVIALRGLAEAEGLRLKVAPFGDPDAYALYRFAEGLPDDLKIELRYAGPGTLWTDATKSAQAALQQASAGGDSKGALKSP